jgi:hypothetical protein
MKHIQTFESKNRPRYRGFRDKQKVNLSMSIWKLQKDAIKYNL